MPSISFAHRVIISGSNAVHFIQCKDNSGKDCHFFLLSPPEKIKALKAITHGVFDIADYGKIIASGFGHVPSASTKQRLKELYQCDVDTLV